LRLTRSLVKELAYRRVKELQEKATILRRVHHKSTWKYFSKQSRHKTSPILIEGGQVVKKRKNTDYNTKWEKTHKLGK